jgi:hypothetical protein
MPTECTALLRGKVARITKVDGCGNPIHCDAPQNTVPQYVVSDGIISIQIQPEIDAGTDITQTNWNGDTCVDVPACPKIRWINLTVSMCKMDPDLFSMWTGVSVVKDAAGNATGFRVRKSVSCDEGVALEIWTGSAGSGTCLAGGQKPRYGYIVIPWVVNGILGDYTIENGAVTFQVTAKGIDGGGWGVGPYDVYDDGAGGGLKLATPFGVGDLEHIDTTTMPPPVAGCGANCTITPVPPTVTVAAAPSDVSGQTVLLTYDNANSGPVYIDWGDASQVVATPTGAGTVQHPYVGAGPFTITVTDTNNVDATTTKVFTPGP